MTFALPDTLRAAAARCLVALTLSRSDRRPRSRMRYEDFVFAVSNDRVPQVKELLAKGIDPNTVDPNGEPALVIAARVGYRGHRRRAARGEGQRRTRRARSATRAIMVAALNGHLDLVKTLRARGAAIDGAGWTPLIYAATGGHDAVVDVPAGRGRERQRGVAERHDGADDGGARGQGSARRRC